MDEPDKIDIEYKAYSSGFKAGVLWVIFHGDMSKALEATIRSWDAHKNNEKSSEFINESEVNDDVC